MLAAAGRLAVRATLAAWLVLAVACTGDREGAPLAEPTVTPAAQGSATPTATATPEPRPTSTPAPSAAAARPLAEVAEAVRVALAARLRLRDPQALRVVESERAQWPNGCLGVGEVGPFCSGAATPGYRILLEAQDGGRYEYRTTLDAALVLLASAPTARIERPLLRWSGPRRPDNWCESLELGADGQALIGPCIFPKLAVRLPADGQRAAELAHFAERFAPFSAFFGMPGQIALVGGTGTTAPPAWRRAIAEWARLVYRELDAGRGGASWGLALAWEQPEAGDRCRSLQVERYGLAIASSFRCGGGDPHEVGRAWLSEAELQQVYRWVDDYGSFERPGPERLVIAGEGLREVTVVEAADASAWMQALYGRIAAGR